MDLMKSWMIPAAVCAAFLMASMPSPGQTAAVKLPRMTDGKPNMTGLWQALGTADWDIQDHASQAGAFFQLGAIGAKPPGQSIVDGSEIPYLPEALAQKKKNHANRYKEDPVIKCYMPGCSARDLCALPVSDHSIAERHSDRLRICGHQPCDQYGQARRSRHRYLDGHVERPLGRRYFGGGRHRDSTVWHGSIAPAISPAIVLHVVERYSMLDANTLNYEATITDPKTFSRPWKISLPSVPPSREECAAAGIQVRGICGTVDLRRPAKEAGK